MNHKASNFIPDYLPILVVKELKNFSTDTIGKIMTTLGYTTEPFTDTVAFHSIGDDARKYIRGEVSKYNWTSLQSIRNILGSSSVLMQIAFYPENPPVQ